jgi:hypothetical protein
MFYEAIFRPSENREYNSDAKKLIGKRIVLQGGAVMDKGPFKRQNYFYIPGSTVGFIPISDLKELKQISFTKWKELQKNLGF